MVGSSSSPSASVCCDGPSFCEGVTPADGKGRVGDKNSARDAKSSGSDTTDTVRLEKFRPLFRVCRYLPEGSRLSSLSTTFLSCSKGGLVVSSAILFIQLLTTVLVWRRSWLCCVGRVSVSTGSLNTSSSARSCLNVAIDGSRRRRGILGTYGRFGRARSSTRSIVSYTVDRRMVFS